VQTPTTVFTFSVFLCFSFLLSGPGVAAPPSDSKNLPPGAKLAPPRKALSAEQQKALLNSRKAPGHSIRGTFDSFCSNLYAFRDVCIHTHSSKVNATELQGVFAEFYHPTFREVFELIARQTDSTMHYDPGTDYWTFDPPAMPPAYSLKAAPGWTVRAHGMETNYIPPGLPCGMDVFTAGCYSSDNPKEASAVYAQARERTAMVFASGMVPKVKPADMKHTTVDGTDALYFECPTPRPGATWRQWAFVKNGQAFLIVSSLDNKKEAQFLPDVKGMVASFRARARAGG
jgi:hypothetical protein